MCDVSNKRITFRTAKAIATINVSSADLEAMKSGYRTEKGSFLTRKGCCISGGKSEVSGTRIAQLSTQEQSHGSSQHPTEGLI